MRLNDAHCSRVNQKLIKARINPLTLKMNLVFYSVPVGPILLAVFDSVPSSDPPNFAFATPYVPSIAFGNVSDTFAIPNAGFRITFPPLWSGIDMGYTVMVAPTGINSKTGVLNTSSDLEKVYLVLAWSNISDVLKNPDDRNVSSYHKYVKDSAKRIGCIILSDEFVKLNGINSERVTGKCGSLGEENMLTYAIGAGKNIIFVGLKGPTPALDYNYETFMRSLMTMIIDDGQDIQTIISKTYSPD